MKISNNKIDYKNGIGSIEIINEHVDDVYALSFIVFPNDIVKCKTQRKILLENKTQQKVSLKLQVKVETVSVDLEHGIMYCKGKINQENEYVKMGLYHTLDIELEQKFELYKENWVSFHMKKLQECTISDTQMLFVVFYEKECVVSNVSRNRISILFEHEVKNKKFNSIFNAINKAQKISLVVIASSFEIRNEFYKQIKAAKEFKALNVCIIKLTSDFKDMSNAKVINKILVTKEYAKLFQSIQYVDDLKEIDSFFVDFARGSSLVSIGWSEIEEAMEYGAIKTLFITDEMFRPNTIDARKNIERFCKQVKELNCKICVIPVAHFSGESLRELGGVCAALQFSYRQ